MKKFFLYTFAVFVLIQLYRPSKNESADITNNITTVENVPEDIQQIMKRSCNDCHSNKTNYLWYHDIAPISFVVANHVKEGKEHLNFDAWATYNTRQRDHIVEEMQEVMETREMPIVGYLKLHPEAVISEADNNKFIDWIKSLDTK